jgi:hypothetical protein
MEHAHQPLARLGVVAIHLCTAGPVTLTVGPVAIALKPEVLRQLRRFPELTAPRLEAALIDQATDDADIPSGWPPSGWETSSH